MVSTGSFDLNKTPISNTFNNTVELASEISGGLADQGPDIGEAIGLFVTVIIFIILIVAVLGIVFLFFRFITSLISKAKGIGKSNGGGF